MTSVLYVVRAEFDDSETADEYVAWLGDGHIQAVCEHGAADARVLRVQSGAGPKIIEAHYTFESDEAWRAYDSSGAADDLRREGREKFASRGVRFSRVTADIVDTHASHA